MSNTTAEIEVQTIAREVELRSKALAIISNRNAPILASLVGIVTVVAVSFFFPKLSLPFWPTLLLAAACGAVFPMIVEVWLLRRRLQAAIDLLLLNEKMSGRGHG